MTNVTGSPRLLAEAEVRAIRARRAGLEADLIEEGASDSTVKRLATDETAARMVEHERAVLEFVMFGAVQP